MQNSGKLREELRTIQLSDAVENFVLKLNEIAPTDRTQEHEDTDPRYRLYLVAYNISSRQDSRNRSSETNSRIDGSESLAEEWKMKLEATWENAFARLDSAMIETPGGIGLNSTNLNLQIKRDGKGVPLPLAQQDLAQLSHIQGFVPSIIEIRPAATLPIFSELEHKT